jgi:hypothetical protein
MSKGLDADLIIVSLPVPSLQRRLLHSSAAFQQRLFGWNQQLAGNPSRSCPAILEQFRLFEVREFGHVKTTIASDLGD